MTTIVAFANHKGGVGKTTVAVHLAYALAYCARSVLLIDLDPQGSAGNALGAGLGPETAALLSGSSRLEACVMQPRPHLPLYLVRSGPQTEAAAAALQARDLGRTTALLRAFRDVPQTYDFVLIDCPPGLSILTVNALVVAKYICAPVGLSHLDIAGLVQLIETVGTAQAEGYSVGLRWIVPNMLRPTRESQRSLRLLQQHEQLGRLVTAPIHLTTDIPEAQAAGLTVFEHRRSSAACQDMMAVLRQVWHDTQS